MSEHETPDLQHQALALARRLPEEDGELIARLLDQLRRYEQFALLVASAVGNASRDLPPTVVQERGRSVADTMASLSTLGRDRTASSGHRATRKR